jgi:protein-disulfide isomerase
MTKMLKASLLFAATLALVACDSGTSTAAPAASDAAGGGKAAASADWTQTVVLTPEGGYRMGNPDAKVKLVEFASFTCGVCQMFHKESARLKSDYVKSGRVSLEYRPFMLNIYDFAATKLAMCEGPGRFFTWADQLFTNKEAWITPFGKLTEADINPLRSLPPGEQVKGLALAGQLDQFAKARGLPGAKFEACMSDQAAFEQLTKRQQVATDTYQIAGTPTFLMNGKKIEGTTWAQIEPQIKDAL